MRAPSYYLDEYDSAKITTHENHGLHDWTATLVSFFGDYSIVLSSLSEARQIKLPEAHSKYEADKAFERFVSLHPVTD